MKKLICKILLGAALLLGSAFAQTVNPADSQFTQNFGTDSINLQNLSVGIQVPVINKTGAIPFNFSLLGTSRCALVTINSASAPQCGITLLGINPQSTYNWTLFGQTPFATLSAYAGTRSTNLCSDGGTETTFAQWYLQDGFGQTYALPLSDQIITETGGTTCAHTSFTDTTVIGGMNVTVSNAGIFGGYGPAGVGSVTVNSYPNGFKNVSGGYIGDTFGNKLSYNLNVPTQVGTFTDTLNTPVLAEAGTNPASATKTYSYYDTSATQRTVSTLQTQNTIKTAFSCPSSPDVTVAGQYLTTEIDFPDGINMNLAYEPVSGGVTGRISQITLRTGGHVNYTYGAINCASMIPSQISRSTTDGTSTYTFATFTGQAGKFGTTTTLLDPGKNKTVYTFMGTTSTGLPITNAAVAITLTQIQKYQNTGTVASPVYSLLSTDVFCYNTNLTNCATTQAAYPITQKDSYHYAGSTSLAMSHATKTFDAVYGNLLSSAVYDYITNQTLTQSLSYGSWTGTTCAAIGSNINNKPCWSHTVTNSGYMVKDARFTYNPSGAMTQSQQWSGTVYLVSNYTPNANGTVASTQDPNGQVTTLAYNGTGGCNNLLPTSASATVGSTVLSTAQTWDCNTGLVLTQTDVNGITPSATQYDSMLRPVLLTDNLGNQTSLGYTNNSVSTSFVFGSSAQNHTTYTDGYGRTLVYQTQQGPSASTYDTVSNSYAYSGTNLQTTISSPCTANVDTPCPSNFTTDVVDGFGRPLSITDPLGGTATYAYNQNDVSLTVGPAPSGEHVKIAQTELDGFGRTSSVCAVGTVTGGVACGQKMGNSGVLTYFNYAFSTGTSTVSANRGPQSHSAVNDAMGRTISTYTPESLGTTYIYDVVSVADICHTAGSTSNGDLMRITTSDSNYTCFIRDGLHRLTDVGNSAYSAANPCKRFRYDLSTNGVEPAPSGANLLNTKGRVVEAETDDCTWPTSPAHMLTDEWFSYDAAGRMTDMWESTPHSAGYFHTSVTYWPNGVIASISGLPGYSTYTFGIDGEGRPYNASLGTTALIGVPAVGTGVLYDAASKPLFVYLGSNSADYDSYTYDPTEKMKTWSFTVNGKTQAGTLTWSPNATLDQLVITDTFNAAGAQTCTFAYDDIARLTDDNCGSTLWHQTFSYDQYNNMTTTGNPGTSWNSGFNIANNQMNSSTYDTSGHLTYDTVSSYSWDAYGKMKGTRVGATAPNCGSSGSFCATYDAMGRIAETSNGATYRWYLYGPTGLLAQMFISGSVAESRVHLPGGGIVRSGTNAGSIYIDHADWMGTKRLSTFLGARSQKYDTAFTPFGETYDSFGTMAPDFTGDRQDIAAGLYDTPNRELAINSHRWQSPDPAHGGWNGYAYTTNPNGIFDPSGLDEVSSGCDGGYDCGSLTTDGTAIGTQSTDPFVDDGSMPSCTSTGNRGPCRNVDESFLDNGGLPTNCDSCGVGTTSDGGGDSTGGRQNDPLGQLMLSAGNWSNWTRPGIHQEVYDAGEQLGLHRPLSASEDWWQRIGDTMFAFGLMADGANHVTDNISSSTTKVKTAADQVDEIIGELRRKDAQQGVLSWMYDLEYLKNPSSRFTRDLAASTTSTAVEKMPMGKVINDISGPMPEWGTSSLLQAEPFKTLPPSAIDQLLDIVNKLPKK